MIKIKTLLKYPLYKRLLDLWCYKWLIKYQANKKTLKLLIYLQTFIICFTWFVSLIILFTMYFGALLYRHRIFTKIKIRITKEFQTKIKSKRHKALGVFFIIIYIISILTILSFVFTIPFILLMIVGFKIEKHRENPKKLKKKKYIIYNNEFSKDKQESKTIGYLND